MLDEGEMLADGLCEALGLTDEEILELGLKLALGL
jgi:hypothetical protein